MQNLLKLRVEIRVGTGILGEASGYKLPDDR